MVFESVVVDVLNRFLGDYVVNLDSSQLSLGIWGGNVQQTCQLSNTNVSSLIKTPLCPFVNIHNTDIWSFTLKESADLTLESERYDRFEHMRFTVTQN